MFIYKIVFLILMEKDNNRKCFETKEFGLVSHICLRCKDYVNCGNYFKKKLFDKVLDTNKLLYKKKQKRDSDSQELNS